MPIFVTSQTILSALINISRQDFSVLKRYNSVNTRLAQYLEEITGINKAMWTSSDGSSQLDHELKAFFKKEAEKEKEYVVSVLGQGRYIAPIPATHEVYSTLFAAIKDKAAMLNLPRQRVFLSTNIKFAAMINALDPSILNPSIWRDKNDKQIQFLEYLTGSKKATWMRTNTDCSLYSEISDFVMRERTAEINFLNMVGRILFPLRPESLSI
jgi:hypothetical protein